MKIQLDQRFWSKTRKEGDCIIWTGANSAGGGVFYYKNRNHFAHRLAWREKNGAIPLEHDLSTTCGNRLCINPDHRRAVPHASHKLQSRGSGHYNSKLNEEKVKEIRRRHKAGEKFLDLAVEFGVDDTTIRHVVKRETWAHVGED